MTERRLAERTHLEADAPDRPSLRHHRAAAGGIGEWRSRRPHTREEVEERYAAARDAWTAAMRAAQSGRAADLANLAIAQDTYETALAEKRRWEASPRAAIPIEPDRPRGIDAIVGQELARRRVHEREEQHRQQKPTGLRGIVRRLRGR